MLHLLHEEWEQGALVLDGRLCHGVEVGLVGRAATLRHHHEAVFSTFRRLDVNLCGEVALRVHLVVHVQRSVLGVAEIILREGVEHALRQRLLVLEASPDLLTLLTVDDGRTGVLTEREDTLASHLGIAQELERHIFVVLARLWVAENLSHLQVMFAAQHELHVVECLLSQQRERLGRDLHDFLAFKLADGHAFLRQQAILRCVLSHLKHGRILNFWCLSHKILEFIVL